MRVKGVVNDAVVIAAEAVYVVRGYGRALLRRKAKPERPGESYRPLGPLGKRLALNHQSRASSSRKALLDSGKNCVLLRRMGPENLFQLAETCDKLGKNQLLPLPERSHFR